MPANLACPYREPEAVGGGNPNLPMGPPGADQHLRLLRSLQEYCKEFPELLIDKCEGAFDLQSRRSIKDIVRGRPVMHKSPTLTALLGDSPHDGHHVVTYLLLDLLRSGERGMVCTRSDCPGSLGRDEPVFGRCPCEGNLCLHDTGEAMLLSPHCPHFPGPVPVFDGMDRHGREVGAAR